MEKDQAVRFIHELLRGMVARKASDLFITAGFPPAFKSRRQDDAGVEPEPDPAAHPGTGPLADERQQAQEFERTKECNFAVNPPGSGVFA